ncbi:MAG: hypothetical protein WC466_08575 [Candidatus Izemoplasmatales bacterium]
MADMFRPVPVEQEPKRKNRFVLEFPTELGIASFLVQTSGKPSMEINSTEIPYMNTSTWVAGRFKWSTIDIEFIDVIGPSTTQKIMEWVRLHAESATGRMGYAIGYKKNIVMKALDPTGVEVEKWTLIGCTITNAAFDDNDYSSDDITKVKVTIQPDRCLLNA